MIGRLPRALRAVCLGMGVAVLPASAQSPGSPATGRADDTSGWWRMSVGLAGGTVTATHVLGETGQSLPVVRLGLERSITDRYSLGLAWSGGWYEDRWGSQRRHALVFTGSAYPWRGLHLSVGVGGGLTSYLDVDPPPDPGFGEVVVLDLEEKGALALTADLAYDIAIGVFDVEPSVGVVAHRLRGELLSLTTVGVRLGMRSWDRR